MLFLTRATRCLQTVNVNSKIGLRVIPTFKINSYNFSVNKGNLLANKKEEKSAEPIKFTKSAAYRLNPHLSVVMNEAKDEQPIYQYPVITISMFCFMIYFFILREENDVDHNILGASLFDHVEGLEKAQIEACIMNYEKNGLDTRDLQARLAELIEEEELEAKRRSTSVQAEQ